MLLYQLLQLHLLLLIGTAASCVPAALSGIEAVYPAAGLIDYFRGDNMVVINRDPVSVGGALFLQGKVGEILSQIEIR